MDILGNAERIPTLADIQEAMEPPTAALWKELNDFIQESFKSQPKANFSACQMQPGWNFKYKKSGQTLCTLYPERNGFTALVVIDPRLEPELESSEVQIHPRILDLTRHARPYLGKYWLMIPISDEEVLQSVKKLLVLKSEFKKGVVLTHASG